MKIIFRAPGDLRVCPEYWEHSYDGSVRVVNGLAVVDSDQRALIESLRFLGYQEVSPKQVCLECMLFFRSSKLKEKHMEQVHHLKVDDASNNNS
jgi:hypothetical protein